MKTIANVLAEFATSPLILIAIGLLIICSV
jgi:hypothetical protein